MDRASSELAAMQAIANTLSALPDGESRDRVLRWALEHFSTALVTSSVSAAVLPAPKSAQGVEAAESHARNDDVDALGDGLDLPAQAEAGVNGSSDPENLESLFEEPRKAEPSEPARAPKSVVSSLESFVADFQKLAHDWKNA